MKIVYGCALLGAGSSFVVLSFYSWFQSPIPAHRQYVMVLAEAGMGIICGLVAIATRPKQ